MPFRDISAELKGRAPPSVRPSERLGFPRAHRCSDPGRRRGGDTPERGSIGGSRGLTFVPREPRRTGRAARAGLRRPQAIDQSCVGTGRR